VLATGARSTGSRPDKRFRAFLLSTLGGLGEDSDTIGVASSSRHRNVEMGETMVRVAMLTSTSTVDRIHEESE
jgi:hypothetical protein